WHPIPRAGVRPLARSDRAALALELLSQRARLPDARVQLCAVLFLAADAPSPLSRALPLLSLAAHVRFVAAQLSLPPLLPQHRAWPPLSDIRHKAAGGYRCSGTA